MNRVRLSNRRSKYSGIGTDAVEVDYGEPAEQEQRHDEPVVRVVRHTGKPAVVAEVGVVDKAVGADEGGDT